MRIDSKTTSEGRRRPSRLLVLLGGGLAVALAAGLAFAAIPGAGGVISGCYGPTGQLRVIDAGAGEACKASETSLSWSQTGPQGPQGPEGPQGPQGLQGPQGPAGPGVHAYVAGQNSVTVGDGWQEIVGLGGLPAGNYLLWAPLEAKGYDADFPPACELSINDDPATPTPDNVVLPLPIPLLPVHDSDLDRGLQPIMTAVTLPTDDSSIKVFCAGSDEPLIRGDMMALKLDALN